MIVNYVTVGCCIKYVLCEPIIECLVVDIRTNVSVVYIYEKKTGEKVGMDCSTVFQLPFWTLNLCEHVYNHSLFKIIISSLSLCL
jgi:hypothetical protein